jgi:hypothetical protein
MVQIESDQGRKKAQQDESHYSLLLLDPYIVLVWSPNKEVLVAAFRIREFIDHCVKN